MDSIALVRLPTRLTIPVGAVVVRDLGRKAGGERAVAVVRDVERLGAHVRVTWTWGSSPAARTAMAETLTGLCGGVTPVATRSGTTRGLRLHPEIGDSPGRVVLPTR
jgi:hypothetical protein